MFTLDEEKDLIERLAVKYLDRCVRDGEIYTYFDLFYDVQDDKEFANLQGKAYIEITDEDLMMMCKEQYDMYFFKPSVWGF